jgi:membrane-associated phospholipid phosphatase
MLLPASRQRRAVGAAIGIGALIGAARIVQGAHFLSDVVASGFFVYGTSWLLHRWMILNAGLSRLWHGLRRPSRAAQTFAIATLAAAIVIAIAMLWLDRPVADALRGGDPAVQGVFRFITRFGDGTAYLVLAALGAGGFGIAAARMADGPHAWRCSLLAWQSAYVFAAVAGAGLLGDLLKPIFGRARPRLWLADHIYGFTWQGARALYWSFPSGHTITIVALAAALARLYPRGIPLYAAAALLVGASRILLEEHYLSDVLAGAYLAMVVSWLVYLGFLRAGAPFVDRSTVALEAVQ